MSPALLDIRAPAHTYIHTEGHSLQNPNPNGQFFAPLPFTFSGFSSNNHSHAMNSSNANNEPSGFRDSNEIYNTPGLGSGKPAFGSASGLSRPRLTKKRQTASHHPRFTPASETGKIDPGFDQFGPVSDNSIRFSFGSEMGTSSFGKVDEGAFVFGADTSNPNSNLNSGLGMSNVNVRNAILDDMRKLKIVSEKEFVNTSRNNSSGFDVSVVSKLPDEMKKLNIEGSGIVESSKNAKGMNADLSANYKTHFSFGSGDNVANLFGKNVVSELPNDMKKLNIKGPGEVDRGGLTYNADDTEKFASGNTGSDSLAGSSATALPNKMKNLNAEDPVNTCVGEKKEVNVNTSDNGSFVFGSGISATSSLGGRTENMISDEMGKLKIGRGAAETAGQTQKGFSSSGISVKEMQPGNLGDSLPREFTFQAGVQGKSLSGIQVPLDHRNDDTKLHGTTASSSSFSSGSIRFQEVGNVFTVPFVDGSKRKDEFSFTSKWDDIGTPNVEFQTPNRRRNVYSGLNQKLESSAKKESIKDTRSKKKRGKLKKPTPVQPWLGQDFISRESSSQENQESSEAYSPMDVSPYPEIVVDMKCSRETSTTSDESFHLDGNHTSGDTIPMVSDDTTNEDLVFATQRMDINVVDAKHTETKEEECFDKGIGAEGPPEESVSGAETESFKSATEQLDNISDTSVTSAETEVSSSSMIERKDSDGRTQFCFASSSEDTDRINFTFAASSSTQGQLSAAARHQKKKNRMKVGQDAYNSTPNAKLPHESSSVRFFSLSGTSSLLSPGQGQKGDAPTSLSKGVNTSEVVKELEINQESISIPAASVAAQEACEKWRLRGNQAYANGDLSKAEDYYTLGVNCVSQSETSRSCLRALMLCYSNRAATRMSLGRMREALGDCLMAGAIDPNFLKVQVRAASCYLALGDVEDASLHFKKCLQSGSDICVDRKLLVEASEGLQKAQKVSECMSQSADLLRRRRSSDAESALEVIAEALTISSYSEKFNEMKAEALFMLRKYEEVIQLCEQTLCSAEMNSPASGPDGDLAQLNGSDIQQITSFRLWRWRLIVKSYFYLGRLEEALDFLKKQEESGSGSKSLEMVIPLAGTVRELLSHKAAGNEAFQSGRHAEAVEHYTAALSCNVESRPFAAICFCNRAAAYRALGQITDAIADCSLAIALDGNYLKQAISRRATLYEMIRDYGQAAIDLQRLVFLLTKQVEEKASYSGASDRMSCVNELRQAQLRLSVMEEARKEIPLNMYLILGLEPSVSASEIRKAYRKAALRHHPDKAAQSLARSENGDDGLWKEVAKEVHKDADRLFKMIGEAYAVLSDPAKRSRYDLDEEIRNTQKRGSGISTSRTHTDVQNYSFERSGSRRQWQEVARSYGNSQPRGSETTRSNRYS
uniref:J domain-containing protein n=1 Tax=Davidia involucrata TaxID=16924 RepID=A0A5B7BJ91_DAVIN